MKNFPWTTVLLAFFTAITGGSGASLYGASQGNPIYQDANNPRSTWSGSKAELEAIVAQAKAKYGFEDSKHLGRNATMLVPATLEEMKREIALENAACWATNWANGAHGSSAKSDDGRLTMLFKSVVNSAQQKLGSESGVVKFTNPNGGEVVYDAKTGRIVPNEKMGTKNFNTEDNIMSASFGGHYQQDMVPHTTKADPKDPYSRDGDQYKYVGILYERDPENPDKFYLVDGQTGRRMTKRQAEEFPTTLSDMWREQGLICVSNDANDVPDPIPATDYAMQEVRGAGEAVMRAAETAVAPVVDPVVDWAYLKTHGEAISPGGAKVPMPSSLGETVPTVVPASAQAYETIDYRPVKNWATETINSAYSQATGIADSEGFGAEYRSTVAPIVNQGLNYIQSIPDQVQVPVGQ